MNINDFVERLFSTPEKWTIFVNEKKKITVLKIEKNGLDGKSVKRYKVVCHPEDKFKLEVGVGLALSRTLTSDRDKAMKQHFLVNKKGVLDYEKFAEYALLEKFNYNTEAVESFLTGKGIAVNPGKNIFLELRKVD